MLDVLVVGAGQAGLAIGHSLSLQELDFLIVDGAAEIGQSWRSRWDSLVLFTPAQFDSLPGMPFPADADTYPTKDDAASYLGAYAERFALPIKLGSPVGALKHEDGRYVASVGSETVEARQVVVATGPFQTPFIPPAGRDGERDHRPAAQRRVPSSRRSPARSGARRRRRQLRLSDRARARRDATGRSRRRRPGSRAAPAAPRQGHLVVGDQARCRQGDDRLQAGQAPVRP